MKPPPPKKDADTLLAEADALGQAGRLGEAADRFAAAVMADPQRPEGYVGMARAQAMRGELEAALPVLSRAVEIEPGYLPAYGLAARIGLHFEEQRFAALRLVEMGVLARDDALDAWVWLARLQAATSRLADLRRTLHALEGRTGRPRHELVRELADDPDMGDQALRTLRKAANLDI